MAFPEHGSCPILHLLHTGRCGFGLETGFWTCEVHFEFSYHHPRRGIVEYSQRSINQKYKGHRAKMISLEFSSTLVSAYRMNSSSTANCCHHDSDACVRSKFLCEAFPSPACRTNCDLLDLLDRIEDRENSGFTYRH